MESFYSPNAMRNKVHNHLTLLQRERQGDYDDNNPTPQLKKMSKRNSSGYGSSIDDDSAMLFTDNKVVMRPKPEAWHAQSSATLDRKRQNREATLGGHNNRRSLDSAELLDDSDVLSSTSSIHTKGNSSESSSASRSPKSRSAKLWWLRQRTSNDKDEDEGVHCDSGEFILSEEEDDRLTRSDGYRGKKNKSKKNKNKLRRSMPSARELMRLMEDEQGKHNVLMLYYRMRRVFF